MILPDELVHVPDDAFLPRNVNTGKAGRGVPKPVPFPKRGGFRPAAAKLVLVGPTLCLTQIYQNLASQVFHPYRNHPVPQDKRRLKPHPSRTPQRTACQCNVRTFPSLQQTNKGLPSRLNQISTKENFTTHERQINYPMCFLGEIIETHRGYPRSMAKVLSIPCVISGLL